MLDTRPSRVALVVSLLLHAALFAPVRDLLPLPDRAPGPTAPVREEAMVFRFVDPQPVEADEPDEPTELLSTTDSRAAQPDAPDALPDGAAYATGRAPVPVTPREQGAEHRPSRPSPETARESPSGAEPAPEGASGPPATAGGTDPRLSTPMATPRVRAPGPARTGGDAPPVPQVDQRLASARADNAFSLNTTAWRWGPYMERLKRAIEGHIAPPAAFYYGTAAWITRVRFRIAPDGTLEELRLLDHRGVDDLQYVAIDAIEGAADYEPLPPDFPEPYLEVTAAFYFNVIQEP